MSANLLSKLKKRTKPAVKYQWWFLILVPLWVVISYFAAQFLIIAVLWLLDVLGLSLGSLFSSTVLQTVISGLGYILTIAITMGVPYAVRRRPTSLEALGLRGLPTWTDIGLTPLAFIAYALLLSAAIYVITALIPSFPADQAQDVGFKLVSRQYEYVFAFAMLVIVGPIAEETLFRGYLYGKLRSHVPMYAAILATSTLFALAHGQWNVAIDTFILSVVMCGLREITGSIWAGILLHMLKNAIAFYGIFVAPLLMLGGQ